MSRYYLLFLVIFATIANIFVFGCLITNCPRGGKRSSSKYGTMLENVKPCVSCGPGNRGQCFGPAICCGPFGCLFGTSETVRCQRDGYFHEREPCIAGRSSCRRNSGRCAADGVCCNQESCHADKECALDEKTKFLQENLFPLDVYSLLNYPTDVNNEK